MVVEVARRFFFFQAEDGIRDKLVTGVQTCALPILLQATRSAEGRADHDWASADPTGFRLDSSRTGSHKLGVLAGWHRSEEHTSELQSLAYLVCRLLLEKKKKTTCYSHLSLRI